MVVVLDPGVEVNQELAHAGAEGHLEMLVLLFEPLSKGTDGRMAAAGGEGRHVEHAANVRSSAPDGAFAAEVSAVAVEGRDAHQRRDLLPVEHSQFGQLGQERGCGRDADPGNTRQERGLAFEVVVGLEQFGDVFLDAFDLLVEQVDDLLDVLADLLGNRGLLAIEFRGAMFDELPPPRDERFEFGLFGRRLLDGPRPNVCTEASDRLGVDAIGLGESTETTGIVTDLARIDDGDSVAGIGKLDDDAPLIASGGFDDDECLVG